MSEENNFDNFLQSTVTLQVLLCRDDTVHF